jgi:hypothetical protein
MLQLFYPQGKSPQYPLDGRLSGYQRQSGCSVEEKNPSPYQEFNYGYSVHSLDTILTELFYSKIKSCSW